MHSIAVTASWRVWLGVRDDLAFDHFVVCIKADLYDLKGHLINLRKSAADADAPYPFQPSSRAAIIAR